MDMEESGESERPSGWSFPARTTAYFIVVSALSMGLLAFIGLGEIREINHDNAEIRVDRAARAAAALFEQQHSEFAVDCSVDGSPVVIKIDSIDRLEPAPSWDSLLDTVAQVNQGAANIFRYNAESAAFDRISTTFTDASGSRLGNSQVEPGIIAEGHPAYDSLVDSQPYSGEVPVAGRSRYAYLVPIVDGAEATVGILAVDVGFVDDLTVSNSRAARRVLITMIVLLSVMAASGIVVMFFAFRPMNRLIKVAHDVGSPGASTAVSLTDRRDEIGYLASGLAKVVELRDDLEHRAYNDDLTGVPNRAAFVRELDERINRFRTVDEPATLGFALLIIDLDSFKAVNDAFGHQAGDDLLKSVMRSLGEALLPGEFLARLGGDEFALLTAPGDIAPEAIEAAAQRVTRSVTEVRQTRAGETTMTASVGVAVLPEHGVSIETAMTNADLALYAVKREGRGHWQLYSPSMSSSNQRRIHLASELRRALHEHEISLEYQPLYAATDGQLRSVEALARWHHVVEGPIPPVEFVAAAENAGLISALGEYVIEAVCAQIGRWCDDQLDTPVVAVNVSTMQLWQPEFLEMLRASIRRHGVEPGRLCLEITESVVVQRDDAKTRLLLDDIIALGVTLSIDDFGTGYSSLSYLHDLPVQQVKIDRMFLAEASRDPKKAQLFAGIISLGLNLGLEVVIEGVETFADLELARRHGAHLVQGWFLDAAMPADIVSERFGTIAAPWVGTQLAFDPPPA
jgi:diguanylate cyclase (GGDEF)-like protein